MKPQEYFLCTKITILSLERGSCIAVYAGSESSWISSKIYIFFICVLKMNEGLTGLERHEGE